MAFVEPKNLTGLRDLLLPALWATLPQGGKGVLDAEMQVNFVEDALDLHVRHRFFSRLELDDNSYRWKCADRLKAALLVTEPTAKDLRVERRRLKWRGETAQKHKPRKIARKARA